MGRQLVLALAGAVAVLAAAGGVALSVSKTCVEVDCVGTRGDDTLTGDNNSHHIAGLEGNDIITGGWDGDTIYGDEGDDTINVREGDGFSDTVDRGLGKKDWVFFDPADVVTHCEIKYPNQ
jgi:Ca2+-binding RTX toxin-like protein